MKLRYAAASPFVRKVMMAAHERGLADRIDLVAVNTAAPDPDLFRVNPLGKIPALELDDGSTLYDSPVICEYFDSLGTGVRLFPAPGPARWNALRLQALGDGIADAAVACRYESLRPDGERSARAMDKQRAVVLRGVDALEAEAAELPLEPHIGVLAVVAALGYLDLRFGDLGWAKRAPILAAWFDRMSERPGVRLAAPPAGV